MKKNMFFLLIFGTIVSILWAVQVSNAKYKDRMELDIYLTSAKMYFQDNATDVTIPYANNSANIDFSIRNYIGQEYTLQDIEYNISISNLNYTFCIGNDLNTVNNNIDMVLTGGEPNSEELHMSFQRLNESNVPSVEEIDVTISTNFPYTYSKTFTVTILNGEIVITGNPTNWTKDDVTLVVTSATPGIELTEYSFDNGLTWTIDNSKTYTENISGLNILAKDNLGETLGPIIIDITKIDKTSPTITFAKSTEYNSDGTSKQVETLIAYLGNRTSVLTGVNATDIQSGISEEGIRCYRNDIEITTTDYFTQVGRYSVIYKVQDEVGNQVEEERQILIRWPLAGKYIVARQDIAGRGFSSSSSPDGLYKDTYDTAYNSVTPFSSKYYYTGPTVDNYLTFAETNFRILNVATNDDIKVLGDISDVKTAWGNSKIYSSTVYNTWSTKWWPRGQIYNNETGESKYKVFTDTEKSHLDLATFYAGRVDKSDDITDIIFNEQTNADNLGRK